MVASIKKCGYFEQSQEDEEEEEEEEEDEGEEEEPAAEGENDEDQEGSGDDAAQPTQVSIHVPILWCRVSFTVQDLNSCDHLFTFSGFGEFDLMS